MGKVAITVTSVYDFPDDIVVEELIQGEDSLGQHIVVNGRKLQPIVDFLEYVGVEDGDHSWDDSDEDDLEKVYECLDAEEYSIIQIDGDKDEE